MDVSARPENLKQFVTDARTTSTRAGEAVTERRASWDAFAAAGNDYGPADTGTLSEALPELLRRWKADEDFVELVQHAFEQADTSSDAGIVTSSAADIDAAMAKEAAERGIDLAALTADRPEITVTDPAIAPVPNTSGFVDDPVCTATGHFVEVEIDLVMPARLALLSWLRTYSSRLAVSGAHGRGWGCWASARCVRDDGGDLHYTGPDGQVATFSSDRAGGWQRSPWVLASPQASEHGGVVLVWDGISDHPGQRWCFAPDGSLLSVDGAALGTTSFEYRDGRLFALHHDSGRHVELDWELDRIVALRSSCGRAVRYRYDDRGDLVAVHKAFEPYRYDLDADGRIEAVWDADGVRLCHNTYDPEGRVLRQVSPFGAETLFSYQPGRVTLVSESTDGPASQYKHDAYGRLVGLTTDDGDRLLRSFDDRGRCVAVTGFDGTTVTNRFDDDGRVIVTRRTGQGEERFERDELGRVVRHDGADGSWTEFEYIGTSPFPRRMTGPEGWELLIDGDGAVRRLSDADGVTLTAALAPDGTLQHTTDALGSTTHIEAHASGDIARLTLPDGHVFAVERDEAGRPLRIALPTGDELSMVWTPAGRLASVTQPDGAITTWEYGTHGAGTQIIDALGRACELHHDHLRRLAAMTTADGRKWSWAHTDLGQVSAEHDPSGATWQFEHDREGRRTAVIDPTGARTAYRYDAVGRLLELVDPMGAVTRFEHDEYSRLAAVVDPEGAVTAYRDDAWGRTVSLHRPDGDAQSVAYTPGGRIAEVRSAEGRGQRYVYDAAGRPVEVHELGGGVARYEWDAVGRLVAVTTPAGRTTRHEYDPLGRVVAIERDGLSWRVGYDHAGRVTARTDPLGATARFRYDPVGNLIAATDPLGRTTRYEWDERNVCVRVVDPMGGTTTYEYDACRRRSAETDQLGNTTRYGRDATGRVTSRALPTGERVDYRRDRNGRITDLRVDGRSALVQELDRCGRPTIVHEPGPNRTHVLSWTPGGRLRSLTTEGEEMAWQYDRDGLVVARRARGMLTRYQHDMRGRLVRQHDDSTGTIELTRDGDGLVTSLRGEGLERTFRHDALGRLVERRDRVGDASTVVRLTRDAAGRVAGVDDGRGRSSYAYDDAGQLVEVESDEGRWTFAYDAAGGLTDEDGPRGERRFRYDAAHRLSAIEGADAAEFDNDELGRRTARRDADGEVRYGWDGQGRLAWIERDGRRRLLDVDAFGCLVGIDDIELRWDPIAPVPELLAIGERRRVTIEGVTLAEVIDEHVRWVDADWRGSTTPSDPWGAATDRRADGGLLEPGFLGELEVDGLVWLRNRAYDSDTRRFLSPDLLHGTAGSPFSTNPFHYAGNDPIGAVDPLGLKPVSIEQYQQYKAEATGWQWANTFQALAMVGAVALAFTPAGPLALAAYGAGTALATEVVGKQMLDQGRGFGEIDWGAATKAGVFGAASGALGGVAQKIAAPALGRALPATWSPTTASVTAHLATEVPAAAAVSTGQEVYDAAGGPGGDGQFDLENIARDSVYAAPAAIVGGVRNPVVRPPMPDPTPPPTPASTTTSNGNVWVPEAPPGMTRHTSGIYVPDGPASVIVPDPPPGMTQHPSGIYVPSSAAPSGGASSGLVLPPSSFARAS